MKRKVPTNFLSVDEIKVDESLKHPEVAHPWLPQHEFSMLIVAPKGSGKTNFICNMILKQYKEYFHKILVCSPTVFNDEKWDVVKETKHVLKENKELEKIVGDNPKPQRKLPKIVFKSGEPVDSNPNKEKFQGYIDKDDIFADMNELPPRMKEFQDVVEKLKSEHKMGKKAKYKADRVLVVMDDQAGLFGNG